MTRTIVIAAVLWLLGGGALWALARYNAKLDGRTGKGSASQAPGSPAPRDWPPMPVAGLRCGGHGPAGMRCDREPHADGRCEQNGIGWRCVTGQIPHDWQWAGDRHG